MSKKHTPGPLFAIRAKQGGDHAVKDRDNNVVAECFEDIRELGECAMAEAKANATLYAAAPDLLEALQDVLRVMEQHEQLGGGASIFGDAARAAIAKATGAPS